MNKNTLIYTVIAVAVIAVIYFVATMERASGELDGFAQCLEEKEAVFYGAFWCPHCQNQKATFGKSAKLLPYVECSTANGKGQLKVCADKEIEGYPTWEFADGSRLSGDLSLSTLAEKTGCELPY